MSRKSLNILCIGDVVGKAGRKVLLAKLASIQAENKIDFTIVNIENASNGFGVTSQILKRSFSIKHRRFTSGNHIFNKREFLNEIDQILYLLRPANFPVENPGKGAGVFSCKDFKIGVINLVGRAFLGTYNCPFHQAKKELSQLKEETPILIVDFHAEHI